MLESEAMGMAVHINLKLHHLYLVILFLVVALARAASQPMPNCPQNCGNLNIPYPFGTSEGCYLDNTFLIRCNHNSTPFLGQDNNITVLNISLDGELVVSSPVVHDCYDIKGGNDFRYSVTENGFNLTHFSISSKNKFTALGCDTVGIFVGYDQNRNKATRKLGCVSMCSTVVDEIKTDGNGGTCNSGNGCCQISIPDGLYGFAMQTWSWNNHSTVLDFNPCNYAFTVREGDYRFSSTDLKKLEKESVPMVLDWAVGNQGYCKEAQYLSRYACKAKNSVCHDSTNGIGYICKCKHGFMGNPYLHHGCQDINECNRRPSPCSRICQNVAGTYKCSCPKGYEGDGLRDGEGCRPKDKSMGNLILIIGLTERATIFTAEELKKATNNYDEERIIGKGGHGTVYKGVLTNGRVVAIKKSMVSNQTEIEQFINEVVVLSQINHRNVVKLLGCCLETEVPLLVYEFITNGTLCDHLHVEVEHQACKLSWTTRLRIAAETAEALAYLHSAASTPIIHRDVKTANILLDENLTTKVSDFGASKLVPLDQTQLTTLVQGTLGYLDPEYFQSSQLTEKSDVYSFGVVLAELLTSKKALSFHRPEIHRNLSMYFVSSMNEGGLQQILDNEIVSDANVEHIIEVANLAKRCLRLKGEERPTMKEVALELEGIRTVEKHSLGKANVYEEETEYFLKVSSPLYIMDNGEGSGGSSTITRFYNLQNQILEPLALGDGR
ncbi:Wall-associated receptor kinase, galacturonan-binding domain [Sesbania bispinosa]|nr:Wall-associated receptor kinase, galacturonan-binding domain [Sesbania bispinosa]